MVENQKHIETTKNHDIQLGLIFNRRLGCFFLLCCLVLLVSVSSWRRGITKQAQWPTKGHWWSTWRWRWTRGGGRSPTCVTSFGAASTWGLNRCGLKMASALSGRFGPRVRSHDNGQGNLQLGLGHPLWQGEKERPGRLAFANLIGDLRSSMLASKVERMMFISAEQAHRWRGPRFWCRESKGQS